MGEFRRFFAESSERVGNSVILVKEYNHIAKVLRARVGDEVIVNFNDGVDNHCIVNAISDKSVTLTIVSSCVNESENDYSVTLYFGLLKSGNTEFVCQKAVELGVSKIVPIESKFTIAKADTAKIDRLSKITQEACKQCGRAKTVPVDSVINIKELADKVAEYDKAILCYENEKHLLLKNSIDKSCRNIAIIIGSEGGFSIDEVKLLTDSGAVCVTLGKRVLRAETASVYALSVIDSVMND